MFSPYGKKQVAFFSKVILISFVMDIVLAVWFHGIFFGAAPVILLFLCFVLYFFRSPHRDIPTHKDAVVSPADGVITHIEECDDPGCLGERALRISIFLSIFDVHINRIAYSGTVFAKKRKPGAFLNAIRSASITENESVDIGVSTGDARLPKYCQRQIAGAIARRIDCCAGIGDRVNTGDAYGMIKFGSRTDLFLPLSSKVALRIRIGSIVRAGSTIIGYIGTVN